ncbi:ATP-grasp fold amidoligase family protein [uncultured Phocaeicola sp.]|uniref:ATP-grasp fold amidoligase family protein n=1 Tax=uncultured Phocaeicola sp. TaxID=990718 RepID=UPI001433FA68|nr:ATP-grasp fold amidoligase family protein [uncultured Phocaeicola sp.]GFI00805.1 hypothetical protein IMSAGC004_03216 [Bacteroidaceae bacterium]
MKLKKFKKLLHPLRLGKQKYLSYYVKSQKYRQLIDTNPQQALEIFWYKRYGRDIDWDNPRTLNEKIQWLEAFTDTIQWTECADKVLMRNYIKRLGLEKYLPKLYGVWECAEDIDFASLPKSFAIKCNHDCGSTVVVYDKDTIDFQKLCLHLNRCVSIPYGYDACEPHYTRIKRCIMAEELLPIPDATKEHVDSQSPLDYKIWCFDGKAYAIFVCYDRINGHAVFDSYDVHTWEIRRDRLSPRYRQQNFKQIPPPIHLDEMIRVAEQLAAGFPQMRVDLYNIDGRIFIGEMTLTSAGGRMPYWSDEFQLEMGNRITLPPITKSYYKNKRKNS